MSSRGCLLQGKAKQSKQGSLALTILSLPLPTNFSLAPKKRRVEQQVPVQDGLLTVELVCSPPSSYQRIGVLVDGPGSFLRGWGRGPQPPTAAAVLRGRLLWEQLGQVIVVPVPEWETLRTPEARAAYLTEKLEAV